MICVILFSRHVAPMCAAYKHSMLKGKKKKKDTNEKPIFFYIVYNSKFIQNADIVMCSLFRLLAHYHYS